ncbi:MAG: shikimate dehydrogenase family protein [Acholeplasmataceae bacterium]
MKRFELIGKSIGYSRSPFVHGILAKTYGLSYDYGIRDIDEEGLEPAMAAIRKGEVDGYNVTVPYKEKVIPLLDRIDAVAARIGAVNTIYREENDLVGANTDYAGFLSMLDYYGLDVSGKRVYVLGNGGAARAVYVALCDRKAKPTIVKRRSSRRDEPFERTILYDEIGAQSVDLFVQTTPLGTYPRTDVSVLDRDVVKDRVVLDLVYRPRETKIMKEARVGYNGLPMLIYQAIESLSLFFDRRFDLDERAFARIKEAIKDE